MDGIQTPRQENGSGADKGLPLDQRLELARGYQKLAMTRRDPLAANLVIFVGDTMSIAHAIADQLQRQLTQGAFTEETRPQFQQNMDGFNQMLHASERLSRLDRQLTSGFMGIPHAR